MAKPRIKRIHVNQQIIRANRKTGANDPPITVRSSDAVMYAHLVEIDGPSKVIYSPDKPLSCGARLWIETTAKVTGFYID
jgi:hypothetical protein